MNNSKILASQQTSVISKFKMYMRQYIRLSRKEKCHHIHKQESYVF